MKTSNKISLENEFLQLEDNYRAQIEDTLIKYLGSESISNIDGNTQIRINKFNVIMVEVTGSLSSLDRRMFSNYTTEKQLKIVHNIIYNN